ncbi:glycosyltransferase [Methylocystis sp. H62]|uniref:glycosyltransferase n=1 Tax=Methylocystis sp. H62 TaxID=2785789 RepID=UPI0018C21052|nr:glycosyltransferase [Methylocystis sp. H62]MBG0792006.1 glycosyltransferase [Methylocystis sp. H62]
MRNLYQGGGLFDGEWYIATNKDLGSTNLDPLEHYVNHGWRELRDPSPHFSIWTYFTLYPEIRASGMEPLKHFILHGDSEQRTPNPAFDPKWYAARYMTNVSSDITPLQHFLTEGASKGYWPHPLFDPKWYAMSIKKAAMNGKEIYIHFLNAGLAANPNSFFDSSFYLRENPDVSRSGLHPLLHYYLFGGFEGRNPSEFFESGWYLATNPDVDNGGINPLAHYLHYGQSEGRAARKPLAVSVKEVHGQLSTLRINEFLRSSARFSFPKRQGAKHCISVIIILFNKANLTFDCIDSLYKIAQTSEDLDLEVIIFDNASTDNTKKLLGRLDNVVVTQNEENVGFLRAVNQAAKGARGKYLLLLNNDTQVQFGALEAACDLLDEDPSVGAVGARLVLPDGKVQEAGSIIWKDGSCLGYGRGRSLDDPSVMFQREVDYCSGAFLMTRTDLFRQLDGFDEAFAPAYYEEADYCARLWQKGYKIVFEPNATIIHFEFGSAASREWAEQQQKKNQILFVKKHSSFLASRWVPEPLNVPHARFAVSTRHRVLFIEDRVPFPWMGSGFPRSKELLDCIVEALGDQAHISLCITNVQDLDWPAIREVVNRRVEITITDTHSSLAKALSEHRPDLTIVCRPHNMKLLNEVLEQNPELGATMRVLYDAEALFAVRDIERKKLQGELLTAAQIDTLLGNEIELTKRAFAVLTVSESEKQIFEKYCSCPIIIVGHSVNEKVYRTPFEQRSGFLFVGSIHDENSPNADSLIWFFEEIWPRIKKSLGPKAFLKVAGPNKSRAVKAKVPPDVELLGRVEDLGPVYSNARVFIAPTRFSAGIPLKVLEAAGTGVPCVITPQLCQQLSWKNGRECLVGADAENFAEQCIKLYNDSVLWTSVQNFALKSIEQQYSPSTFNTAVRRSLELAFCQESLHDAKNAFSAKAR